MRILGITSVLSLITTLAFGQQVSSPEASATQLLTSVEALQKSYTHAFGVNQKLFNGPEYLDYNRALNSPEKHQFFLSLEKQSGGVCYNGQYFPDLKLQYDLVLDQLVLQHPTTPLALRLVNENVQYFFIGTHRFTRIATDSSAATGPVSTGFYEVLVDGPVQLLARRAKLMRSVVDAGRVYNEFQPVDELFIRKAGAYYPVGSKRSIVRLLADRSKEVQRHIQSRKLKFSKTKREADMLELIRYYGTLLAP